MLAAASSQSAQCPTDCRGAAGEVDLDTLSAELFTVVDQTVQSTQASL
jgi:hypothetical protein